MKPLFRMDDRERDRAMLLLLQKEKLAELQKEVAKLHPAWTKSKIKQVAIRRYIWKYGGGMGF